MAVAEGYETLGLPEQAERIRTLIVPVAEAEGAWRTSIRNGSIETFFQSYDSSGLPALDELVSSHDTARCALVRANPTAFTEADSEATERNL